MESHRRRFEWINIDRNHTERLKCFTEVERSTENIAKKLRKQVHVVYFIRTSIAE